MNKLILAEEIMRKNDCYEARTICSKGCSSTACEGKISLLNNSAYDNGDILIADNPDGFTVLSEYYVKAECEKCIKNCPEGINNNELIVQVYMSKKK